MKYVVIWVVRNNDKVATGSATFDDKEAAAMAARYMMDEWRDVDHAISFPADKEAFDLLPYPEGIE
jgi:hypothetical protein